MKRFANKMKDRFQQQFNQQYQDYNEPSQEGKVTIEKTESSIKTKSTDLGEYVEFDNIIFTVQTVENNRIGKVKIQKDM